MPVPEAAERVAGYRVLGPSRRDAEVAMVCAFLARFSIWGAAFIFGVAAATPVAQPRALRERQRIAQAAGLTPGIVGASGTGAAWTDLGSHAGDLHREPPVETSYLGSHLGEAGLELVGDAGLTGPVR